MKSIALIVDYFGKRWPEWFPLFLESCARNPSIHWIIHTDCPGPDISPPNVTFARMSWAQFKSHVSRKLQISFDTDEKYKICDLRPAYGVIWQEEIADFDFFGWSDIDVIYGNLRHFLTDEVLQNHVVSTHEWCFSGHFCLLRNDDWIRNAFRKLRGWRKAMESHENQRYDEDHLIRAFLRPNRFTPLLLRPLVWLVDRLNPLRAKYRKVYRVEQYTTPLVEGLWSDSKAVRHSDVWYWKDGEVTNQANGNRRFMYLHFMNYVSGRHMDRRYGQRPPWGGLDKLLRFDADQARAGFRIDLEGFHSLDS